MNEHEPINPNTADAEALQSITGIGPALADRIIAARPHNGPDDLLRVNGISAAFLDNFRARLVFDAPPSEEPAPEPEASGAEEAPVGDKATDEPAPDAELPAEAGAEEGQEIESDGEEAEETEDTPEMEAEDEPTTDTAPSPAPQPARAAGKEPRYITRGQAFWMSATAALFAFILAVALTLAVLSALNNGLRFARPDQVRSVQAEVAELQGQQETLDADITGLRTRMDNFETLGGRVNSLESDVDALRTDLDTVSGEVDHLGGEIAGISEAVDQLAADTGRFQAFLDGLADLLGGLAPEAGNE